MADLSITAANVRYISGNQPQRVKGGATITAGQVVYRTADGLHALADANVLAANNPAGIALTAAVNNGEMVIAGPGCKINVGATTAAGVAYCLSATAGGIAPIADLTANDRPTLLFWGTGNAEVELIISRAPASLA